MSTHVRTEPNQVKFFPGSNGNCVITRGNHAFELFVPGNLQNLLPICEQRLVLEMRVCIERTERETTTGT
jgi:hypothetical protein